MIEVFKDKELMNPVVDSTLYENITYYLKLKKHNTALVEKEIVSGLCAQFIDWHPTNIVGQITFRNVIGNTNILGTNFLVKSTKFLTDLSGDNQADYLIKDISKYSSTLIFSPAAPGNTYYDIASQKVTNNIFYIYKYLSHHLFRDSKNSLQYLFDVILDNPHFNQRTTPSYIPTFQTKKFNNSTFVRLANTISESILIPPWHDLYEKPFIKKMPNTINGEKLLPKYLYSVSNSVSYDTAENRFLKYFLLWCQEIFLNIRKRYNNIYQISDECDKSLKIIRKYINHPFFKKIGSFSYLPINSSVLINRFGYKEIFLSYLKCRNQPKVFEGYLSDIINTMGIKDISLLYEYWVFFRIAEELFSSNATLEVLEEQIENNHLKFGLKVSNEKYSLYYNKTYKHSPTESYNFSLRPDISLEVKVGDRMLKYFFDAKYSNTSLPSTEDEPVAVYKNQNVVKMLSYLEAIKDSEFAVILYPGTKFAFYSKQFTSRNNYVREPSSLANLQGVGAVPLSPNHVESDIIFKNFMNQFKKIL